jgi:hypothetical protein
MHHATRSDSLYLFECPKAKVYESGRRRVVRGNTYAAQVLPATAVPDPVVLQKEAEERKLRELKARQRNRYVYMYAPLDACVFERVDALLSSFLYNKTWEA